MTATPTRTYTSYVVVRWSDVDVFKRVNHARQRRTSPRCSRSRGRQSKKSMRASSRSVTCGNRSPGPHPAHALRQAARGRDVNREASHCRCGPPYEVRSIHAAPDSKPAVTATTQLVFADPEAGFAASPVRRGTGRARSVDHCRLTSELHAPRCVNDGRKLVLAQLP